MAGDTCQNVRGDPAEREARLAEERFLLIVQVEMQRLLNDKGLKYKDLSKRLNVSEARVSQMFSDEANNLTIRTIAKIFHQLGEKPVLLSKKELERRLAEARGASDPAPIWTFAGSIDELSLSPCTRYVPQVVHSRDLSQRVTGNDWAFAEKAVEERGAHAA